MIISRTALLSLNLFWGSQARHLDFESLRVSVNIPDNLHSLSKASNQGESSRGHRNSEQNVLHGSGPAPVVAADEYKIELDYEDHIGFLSEDGKYIKFMNIPYAMPPVGDARFASPQSFYSDERRTNNGSKNHLCPQFIAGWMPLGGQFITDALMKSTLPQKWDQPISIADYSKFQPKPEIKPQSNEDCLLLDVTVPKKVWEDRNEFSGIKAASIVFIHGGGFIMGSKNDVGSAEGLLNAVNETNDQMIFIAMNYRLGAFGFMSGDDEEGGVMPNLGLLDQRLAMEWVSQNIGLFGGARNRITAMGHSSGGSSIMHHMTSYGGRTNGRFRGAPPFSKAIIHSAGNFPLLNLTSEQAKYSEFLRLSGAKDIEELLKIDSKKLMQVNADMTYASTYGLNRFGPSIDGPLGYVPRTPSQLLADGFFHKGISTMIGYTKFDGLISTPPWIRSDDQLTDYVQEMYPGVPDSVLTKIRDIYPLESKSSAKDKVLEAANFVNDLALRCNSHYVSGAPYNNFAVNFRYVYNIAPAKHGADVPYTFYPAINDTPSPNPDVASTWQRSIVNFARYFDPNEEDNEIWPAYIQSDASRRKVMNFGSPDQLLTPNYQVSAADDQLNQAVCDYWGTAPYYDPSSSPGVDEEMEGGQFAEYLSTIAQDLLDLLV